jgi:predicted dehydrogenase
VGSGGWGDQHARVFSSRDDTRLVGIWSRRLERARERARRWSTEGFDDLDEMIDQTRPGLISVCLPNTEHFAITRDLVDRGIPLLVEKPLVFELDQGRELVRAVAERSLFAGINFNHRFAQPVQLAAAAIAAGSLGELSFVTWRFAGEGSSEHHPYANLIETQCHGIDMVEHLAGPIDSVSAAMTDRDGAHDTMVVALQMRNGAVGSLVGSYSSSYAYPKTQLIEVDGLGGRVLIEDTVRRYTFSAAGSTSRQVWEAGYFDDGSRSFTHTFDRHVDELVLALQEGRRPPVPVGRGLDVLEVCHAIIHSFETGRRVRVIRTSET